MLIFDFHKIGNNLYRYRKALNLTQEQVAELANLSSRTYADMERGNVNIRMETLLRICTVLRITPDDVLTEDVSDPSISEHELFEKLNLCNKKEKETALRLLSVYLDSLNQKQTERL